MPVDGGSDVAVPNTDLLTFVFDHAVPRAESKPAFIDANNSDRYLTVAQTRTLVRKLIAGWKAVGLESGDCVVVVLGNNTSAEPGQFLYSASYFSIIGAGGIYFGANPALQAIELDHILKLGAPKFVITSSDILPHLLEAPSARSLSREQLLVLDHDTFPLSAATRLPASPPPDRDDILSEPKSGLSTDISVLTQYGELDWLRFDDEETSRSTAAAMFSTSGTSGLPKGAILSHYALVNQHLSLEAVPSYEVKRLVSLPFFHIFAALFVHVWPIRLAQPLYVMPRYQMEQFLEAVQRFQITDTVMAPPIVHGLNKSSSLLSDMLSSIRWIGVGGAPIAAEPMQQLRQHLHQSATLCQVWGMTEIGAATALRYPEQGFYGSIGAPLPGYEFRLVNSSGDVELGDNKPGELQVRYPGTMTGYKSQPIHPRDEWFPTGDVMIRVDGKYYVVGRSKELIKVNGWQVAPAELEATIMSHPGIQDAGVIGVTQDDGVTEVPRAYVVRKPTEDGRCSSISAEEIYEFTRARLVSYKALKGGICFVDHIPRTASGKVQRFKLKQMDDFRRSVTDTLLQNNSELVSAQMENEVASITKRAEEQNTTTEANARVSSLRPRSRSTASSVRCVRTTTKKGGGKRASRVSLIQKIGALEASRFDATRQIHQGCFQHSDRL